MIITCIDQEGINSLEQHLFQNFHTQVNSGIFHVLGRLVPDQVLSFHNSSVLESEKRDKATRRTRIEKYT